LEQPLCIEGRWPDFLIIGAQKAGTTWLYRNLAYHPEIWMPLVKEVHFFSSRYAPSASGWEGKSVAEQVARAQNSVARMARPKEVLDRHRACLAHMKTTDNDDLWYQRIFAFAGSGQAAGEASTFYPCCRARRFPSSPGKFQGCG
jgi:hypothetical protein